MDNMPDYDSFHNHEASYDYDDYIDHGTEAPDWSQEEIDEKKKYFDLNQVQNLSVNERQIRLREANDLSNLLINCSDPPQELKLLRIHVDSYIDACNVILGLKELDIEEKRFYAATALTQYAGTALTQTALTQTITGGDETLLPLEDKTYIMAEAAEQIFYRTIKVLNLDFSHHLYPPSGSPSKIFGSGSLQLLIDNVRKEHPKFYCYTCDSMNEFTDCIRGLKDKSEFQGKVALLVRSSVYEQDGVPKGVGHVTPVLIDCQAEGNRRIAILDSVGLAGGKFNTRGHPDFNKNWKSINGYTQNVYTAIQSIYEDGESRPDIYLSEEQRQQDKTSCPVFSWNDSKKFLLSERDFFKLPPESIIRDKSDNQLFMIKFLPPAYMQETQSVKSIKKYLKSTSKIFDREEMQVVEKSFKHTVRVLSDESRNVKVGLEHPLILKQVSRTIEAAPDESMQKAHAHNTKSFLKLLQDFTST